VMSARNYISVLKRDDVPDDILRAPPAVPDETQVQELTTGAAAKSPSLEGEPIQAFLQSGVIFVLTFLFRHRLRNARHRLLIFLLILTFRVPSWRRCSRLIASSISGTFISGINSVSSLTFCTATLVSTHPRSVMPCFRTMSFPRSASDGSFGYLCYGS
jgi:hypothetical protein